MRIREVERQIAITQAELNLKLEFFYPVQQHRDSVAKCRARLKQLKHIEAEHHAGKVRG